MPHSSRLYSRLALLVIPVALAAASMQVAPTAAGSSPKHADPASPYVRVLVKLRPHSSPRSLGRAIGALGARRERTLRHLRVVVVRVPRRNAAALISRLARSSAVKYVERDHVAMRITASAVVQETPTDPLWGLQWGASLTQAPTAWAVTKGSPNIVVAVLDTGVDLSQPDLQGAFVPGYDFVNHDSDPSDDHGHGTGTAGIVAARAGNGLGGAGFCPRCSIMPVKVVGADGMATDSNVAPGITWAADHGARVINLSLGGTYSATIADAINYAIGKGVLVVAAAGNNGNSNAFYPAANPGVLSVAATQPDDQLYSWSNYGSWVSVAAPGCDLTTARGGQYAEVCGTSASTPVVSGLAALAMSYSPSSSAEEIKLAITSSAHAVGGVSYGRVDVADTLAALGATFALVPDSVLAPVEPSVTAPSNPPGSSSGPGAPPGVREAVPGRRVVKAPHRSLRRGWRVSRSVRHVRLELLGRGH
ncbi:MAG: S8 family peptidase [Actinomycetota bacterium]|nr:S8 family peptidase [Actinomycetota bacterium]